MRFMIKMLGAAALILVHFLAGMILDLLWMRQDVLAMLRQSFERLFQLF